MIKRMVLGQIRHLLGASGAGAYGYMIAMGVEPTDANAIIAGAIALVSAIWSAWDKYKDSKKES